MGQKKRMPAFGKWLLAATLAMPVGLPAGGVSAAADGPAIWTNSFDPDAFPGWGLWAGDGSTVTKDIVNGVTGKAVQIDYDRSSQGWGLVAHAELPADWKLDGTRTIQFYAKGDGEAQDFFVGVEEKDGGDKFRKLVTIGGRDWTLVTVPVSELEHQDGGDGKLDWDKVNSLNISPEINRAGRLTIDDLTLGAFDPSLTNTFAPDAFTDWGLWAGDGSKIEKAEAEGASGKGMRFDYTRSEAGWGLVAHGSLPADWKLAGTQSIRFMIRGDGTARKYSVGVEEKDGGDKFRSVINVSGTAWTTVELPATALEYQDGGGNHALDWDLVNSINISPEDNGTGYWMLDEFSFYKGGLLPSIVRESVLKLASVTTGMAGSVFAGNKISLQAKVGNAGTSATQATELAYVVKDGAGSKVLSGKAPVAAMVAGGETSATLSFEVPKYGYYTLEAVVTDASGAESTRIAAFASIAAATGSARASSDPTVGYSTHYDYLTSQPLREQEASLIRQSGGGLVRNDMLWDQIEPSKGKYDWKLYDQIVAANKKEGLQMIGLLAYSATWASTSPVGAEMPEHYAPRSVSEYADFVYKTVSRYKNDVHAWEIWNEPNLDGFFRPTHDAEAYVELLKAGYLAAKRADPKATVVMSGLSGTGGGYLDEMIALGAAKYTDAVVIHPYQAGDPEAGDSFVHDIAGVQAKMPGKPIWLTEWGWRTDEQGADKQAVYTVKGYLLAKAMNVQKNALYSFNVATDTQFGLADSSIGGTVKPVYPAVAAMNRILSGHVYMGDVKVGNEDATALAFGKSGSSDGLLALWSAKGGTVKLKTGKSVKQFDLYGNETVLTPVNGEVTVQLSEQPTYVQGALQAYIRSAKPRTKTASQGGKPASPANVYLMKSPYYKPGNVALTRGFDNTFSVEVYNYTNRSVSGKLQLQGIPSGWFKSSSAKTQTYSVKPYSSKKISFVLKPPSDAVLGTVQATVKEVGGNKAMAAKKFALDVVPKLAVQADKKAVRLTNTTDNKIAGTLALAEPAGWTLQASQTTFTVEPGKTATIAYTLEPKAGTKASGTLALSGSVQAEGETIPFSQVLYAVTAAHAAKAPVIDGKIDAAWQSAAIAAADQASQVSADYRSNWQASDLSAGVRFMWDASRLYVLAVVKDDKAFQPQSGGGMWQGDSLQLAFDARNEAGPGYGSQVYELQIGKPDGADPQIFKGMGFAQSGLMANGQIAVVRNETDGTTVYELSIPFSELEGFGEAATKKATGLSFLVNDSDGSGREGYIEWSSGVGGAKNASQFGTLWLN
ncbi:sugar-binding protein [Cohnella yongneupensis]|uniref:Sugar-binding protein n=1 Tax=Cohnella yongneupensis TaxID=425006 RepID=A0ABW0R5W0_9BACL